MALALVFALPTWVAADTTPITVAVNAPVTFTGTGFAPNESLAIWETSTDGTSTPQGQGIIQADGNGGFTTNVTFPSAGQWTATAYSVNTQKTFTSTYTVGTAAGTTGTIASGSPATGTPVGVGVSTTFSGSGFNANEVISVWETGPDGKTAALSGIQADNTGAFTDLVSFPAAGQWQVTAKGTVSLHQVISPFAVGTTSAVPATTTGTTTTGTVGGAGFNGTPASIGVAVTFSGSGFNGNERISLWTTAPDSTTAALSGIQADSAGGFTTSVTFLTAGNWQVTAQGHDSTHQVIGRYAVTDSSSTAVVTSPSAPSTFTSPNDVPLNATTGTTVTYIATGFNAGEYVAAWVTPPDATAPVTALDKAQASSTGRVAISTSFPTAGLWQITLRGYDSAHQVIGKYQVTAQT